MVFSDGTGIIAVKKETKDKLKKLSEKLGIPIATLVLELINFYIVYNNIDLDEVEVENV